jgi:hypothetical protein
MMIYEEIPVYSPNSCCYYFINPNIHFLTVFFFWFLVLMKTISFLIYLVRRLEEKFFHCKLKKLRIYKSTHYFFWWIFYLWKFSERTYDLYLYIMKNDLFYIISSIVLVQKLLYTSLNFIQVKNLIIKVIKTLSFKSDTKRSSNPISSHENTQKDKIQINRKIKGKKAELLKPSNWVDDTDFKEITLLDDDILQEKKHLQGEIIII